MTILTLTIRALATWRITNILIKENGPWSVFRRTRQKLGVEYVGDDVASFKYEITVCTLCASVWVGTAASVLPVKALMPFALSAAAVLLNKEN